MIIGGRTMTFEEWLEGDEGVLIFGLNPEPEWIDEARKVWNAAIEAAAGAADGYDLIVADIRALSSNAALTGAGE